MEETKYSSNDPEKNENNRMQREIVKAPDPKSRYQKTIETVLVVHGWKTPAKTEPMSLIILRVKLDCPRMTSLDSNA